MIKVEGKREEWKGEELLGRGINSCGKARMGTAAQDGKRRRRGKIYKRWKGKVMDRSNEWEKE